MKNFLTKIYKHAKKFNDQNILTLLECNNSAKLLDVGCGDGSWTRELGLKVGTSEIYGIDISEMQLVKAQMLGVKTDLVDLNNDKIPHADAQFDVVHSNQVIEHIFNSDNFLAEIFRVLKPGGYAVISTENASSWCNVFASIMGWQIFSLTNFSRRIIGLGNPLALHMREPGICDIHNRIYNVRGLREYFEIFGFSVEKKTRRWIFSLTSQIGGR